MTAITDVYEATIEYLANADVRARFRVAYWDDIKTLAVSADMVRAQMDQVTWLTVDHAFRTDVSVVALAGGQRIEESLRMPVVLGEVTR